MKSFASGAHRNKVMINVGKVFIPRNIRDHWLWRDPKKYLRWTDLVMDAAWEHTSTVFGNTRVELERGQIVTSIRTLMHRWGTNSRYVSDFLDLLEAEKMIVTETTKVYTLITILGYDEQQRGLGNGFSEQNLTRGTIDEEHLRLHQRQREGSQSKEDNNIKNNNSSSSSTREENLKFFENLKNKKNEIEDLATLLECEAEKIRTMMEKFIIEAVDEEHGSAGKFRTHFINWARKHLEIQNCKNNGNGKQQPKSGGGGSSPDKYENRRGTDAKDHAEEDYFGTF